VTATRRVAAFDFDGTLTRKDTLLPFLVHVHGRRRVAAALGAVGPPWRRRTGRHRRDDLKERVLARLFRGDDPARIREAGASYGEGLVTGLLPAMKERLDAHREAGHEVIIVSASLHAYLDRVGELLGVDAVIAVDLEVGDDGRYTGELVGPNVRGPEKAVRLQAWAGEEAELELWAYGNSSGDAELLALAAHPEWVGRRRR
jgi:phosphatidylglycerophosphatase C